VLVSGEAGIGKTSLVRAFAREASGSPGCWWGLRHLVTPRTLGPFRDMAHDSGGPLLRMRLGGCLL
jgi:MoxR-like ATPase